MIKNLIWAPNIPSDWTVGKLKHYCSFHIGGTPKTTVSKYYEGNNVWINISDMKGKCVIDSVKHISNEGVKDAAIPLSKKGSLLYAFKLTVGTVCFCGKDLYTNEAIATFKESEQLSLRYLYYLAPVAIIHNANENIYGSPILNQELIKNALLCFPPIEKQVIIADYLDEKCKFIHEYVANCRKMVRYLDDYQDSLVTELTTGFNDADQTNPGQLHNDCIQSYWECKHFGKVMKERNLRNKPVTSHTRLSLSIDKGVTLYSEKTTNLDRYKDDEDLDQYKLAFEGDLVFNSMNMIVGATGVSPYFGCISPAYYTYYDDTKEHWYARYYEYYFKTKAMKKYLHSIGKGIMSIDRGDGRVNTCRLKISRQDLKTINVPCPPTSDVIRIVKTLDGIVEKINHEKDALREQIKKCEEYERSIVYELVKGGV